MRRLRAAGGYTALELMIALFLSLIVIYALGRLVLANQRSWAWGREKVTLQQNASEALEWISRSVRAGATLQVPASNQLQVYSPSGSLTHGYACISVGGEQRLQEDGIDLVEPPCTQFQVTPNGDTTCVELLIELEDAAGNRVAATTRSAVRNRHLVF